METVNTHRDKPASSLRINSSVGAARRILSPIILEFVRLYPEMQVDLVTEDRPIDIVAEGFDVGVRPGDTVPADMIAVHLEEPIQRSAVVGSPDYFEDRAAPEMPQDLQLVVAHYKCSVVSVRGGPVKTADGMALVTDSVRTLSRTQIDTLIVPGAFLVDDVTRDRDLVQWVRKKASTCRRVCSVCAGSFLLAAAGVLDGRRAATHWTYAPVLASGVRKWLWSPTRYLCTMAGCGLPPA